MAASPAVSSVKALRATIATAEVLPVPEFPAVRAAVHTMPASVVGRSVRRRITPEAGVSLGILGHAIEYLADEYVHHVGRLPIMEFASACSDPQVEAMKILMAANRQVYLGCPPLTPLYQRIARRFRRR